MLNDVLWDEKMKISTQHQALVLGRIQKAKNNPDRLQIGIKLQICSNNKMPNYAVKIDN
jgi:hypothetical protein